VERAKYSAYKVEVSKYLRPEAAKQRDFKVYALTTTQPPQKEGGLQESVEIGEKTRKAPEGIVLLLPNVLLPHREKTNPGTQMLPGTIMGSLLDTAM
jgi:hypothetical protein